MTTTSTSPLLITAIITRVAKVLPQCLISSAICREDIWGSEGIAPPFLTSALDGCECSASHPGRYTPGTHWIGGCVGRAVCLDAVKRKILHSRESNPGRPARSPSLYRLLRRFSVHVKQSCTRLLHACIALCRWADFTDEPAPPTIP
jgi:hypothetical protein